MGLLEFAKASSNKKPTAKEAQSQQQTAAGLVDEAEPTGIFKAEKDFKVEMREREKHAFKENGKTKKGAVDYQAILKEISAKAGEKQQKSKQTEQQNGDSMSATTTDSNLCSKMGSLQQVDEFIRRNWE